MINSRTLPSGLQDVFRVSSCHFVDRPCSSAQTERSTKSLELNTKLVSSELKVFWFVLLRVISWIVFL
jgi:hypothetical protein